MSHHRPELGALGAAEPRRRQRLAGLFAIVDTAKGRFNARLTEVAAAHGVTLDAYHRYLSMQYHLTRDVQRHFLGCASNHSLMTRKSVRDFLFRFANEEEPHYLIARQDLAEMGLVPLPCPPDVALWHAYFLPRVADRPFHRLGATAVLENLGAGAGATGRELLARAPFLTPRNTRFLEIHFHEVLPHGEQIFDALLSEDLSDDEIADAEKGAMLGSVFYFRMVEWVFMSDSILAMWPDVELTLGVNSGAQS